MKQTVNDNIWRIEGKKKQQDFALWPLKCDWPFWDIMH